MSDGPSISIVDEVTNLANLVEDKTRSLMASGRLQELDSAALAPIERAAARLVAPAQELNGTLQAMPSNRAFQEMVDKFLSVDRKLSGIASDDEAAAIGRFRKAIVIVADTMDRIEVRSGVVDIFSVVIVRAGDALVRYLKVYNEFISETRSESVSLNTDNDRKFVARDVTFWLDRDDGWTEIEGEVDATLRAAIGRAADGVSDDSMVQMVYGALSGQIDDLNALPESVLADATEFVLGEFTEGGGAGDDADDGGGDDDGSGDGGEGDDNGDDDDDDDNDGQPQKRSKTDDGDDDDDDGDGEE